MLKQHRNILFVLIVTILILACNLPVPTEPPATDEAVVDFTATPTATTEAAVPVQECSPIVTTTTLANVRSGPDVVYAIIGNIPQGGTAAVAGKNFDGSWWYIQFPGGVDGFAWISGLVTTATCIPPTLPLIAAPPPPVAASPVPGAPSATAVPTSSGPVVPPLLLDPPLFFFLPTFTPTPIIIDFPDFDLPDFPFP